MTVLDSVGLLVRFTYLASAVLVVGAAALLLLAGRSDRPTAVAWSADVTRRALALTAIALLSVIAAIAWQTVALEGRASAAIEPAALAKLMLDTHGGRLWLVRGSLLLLLATFLAMDPTIRSRRDWQATRMQVFGLATVALVLGSLSGHAAAVEPGGSMAVAADAIHLLGTGVWIGGLAPLALLLRAADRGEDARAYAVLAARRFSRCALIAVLVLLGSGLVNGAMHVGSVAALVGTPYGRLLLAKLALLVPIVAVGAMNRRHLPALSGDGAAVGKPAMRRLSRFVSVEAVLALAVLAIVAAMAVTPPGRHEQPVWPLDFRLTTVVLADVPTAQPRVLVGSQVAVLGLAGVLASLFVRSLRGPLAAGAGAVLVFGLALALPPLAVDAYPTTYRRPEVPYHAASIAAGARLYDQHCVACHGPGGAGDGPAAAGLPRPPADLRAPHTGHHTAGDLFWWITHGVPRGQMPGFGERLTEPERWDIVNFVRALGAAAAARPLGPVVEPDRPWLVAPAATFAVGPTPARQLRDYRGRRMVLLTLYTLPASRARLAQLADTHPTLAMLGVEIIAVPTDGGADALKQLGPEPRILFPVVTEGAAEIVTAYGLFGRVPHAEFLIDRQGYLRARWLAAGEATRDLNLLLAEVQQLNTEKAPPPADEHVH